MRVRREPFQSLDLSQICDLNKLLILVVYLLERVKVILHAFYGNKLSSFDGLCL